MAAAAVYALCTPQCLGSHCVQSDLGKTLNRTMKQEHWSDGYTAKALLFGFGSCWTLAPQWGTAMAPVDATDWLAAGCWCANSK